MKIVLTKIKSLSIFHVLINANDMNSVKSICCYGQFFFKANNWTSIKNSKKKQQFLLNQNACHIPIKTNHIKGKMCVCVCLCVFLTHTATIATATIKTQYKIINRFISWNIFLIDMNIPKLLFRILFPFAFIPFVYCRRPFHQINVLCSFFIVVVNKICSCAFQKKGEKKKTQTYNEKK